MTDKDSKSKDTADMDAPDQLLAGKDFTPYPDGVNDALPDNDDKAPDKERFNPLRAFAALFGFDVD